MSKKSGRPSKLTDEVRKRLLDAITLGMPYKQACTYAGIHYSTFRRWMDLGESASRGEFCEFCDQVREAEGKAAMALLGDVRKAGGKDWRASAWILERRYPEEFGKIAELVHSGEVAIVDTIAAVARSLREEG